MNKNTFIIALTGIYTALVFVCILTESTLLLWMGISAAVLSLLVVMTFCLHKNLLFAFLGGLIIGLCSFLTALILGVEAFMHPMISIVPRMFIGVSAYGVYLLVKKLTANSENKYIKEKLPYALGAGAGIIVNTVLVVAALSIFGGFAVTQTAVQTIALFNFLPEFLVSVIFAPFTITAVKKVTANKSNK